MRALHERPRWPAGEQPRVPSLGRGHRHTTCAQTHTFTNSHGSSRGLRKARSRCPHCQPQPLHVQTYRHTCVFLLSIPCRSAVSALSYTVLCGTNTITAHTCGATRCRARFVAAFYCNICKACRRRRDRHRRRRHRRIRRHMHVCAFISSRMQTNGVCFRVHAIILLYYNNVLDRVSIRRHSFRFAPFSDQALRLVRYTE